MLLTDGDASCLPLCYDEVGFEQQTVEQNGSTYLTVFNDFSEVPKRSYLWKTYDSQDMYRVFYAIGSSGESKSKVVSKITISEPSLCHGSLVSVLNRLISDNTEPKYSSSKNNLVTERAILVGDVCVYRDFVWNVNNPHSFMQKNFYQKLLLMRKLKCPTSNSKSLWYDVTAIQSGNPIIGRAIPLPNERPRAPSVYSKGWCENKHPVPTPFWPDIRKRLIYNMQELGWLLFHPTVRQLLESFVEKDISKEHLFRMTSVAIRQCIHCHQDFCVWCMNGTKIIEHVEILRGGVWHSFYSNKHRRTCAYQLTKYVLMNFGRYFGERNTPICVVIAIEKKWPETHFIGLGLTR